MRAFLITCIALFSIVQTTAAGEPPILESRVYPAPGSDASRIATIGTGAWQEFFDAIGVDWPDGSSIKHFSDTGYVVAKNTPANLKILDDIFGMGAPASFQISIGVDYVEFNMADLDKLAREGVLSCEALLAIWRKGDARLLFSPRLVAQPGMEATVKAVKEYIYPTEFAVKTQVSTNTLGSEVISTTVVPGGFETREVGVILSVLPDVDPTGRCFYMTLTPEVVHEPTWKNYGGKRSRPDGTVEEVPMEQPIFQTYTLQTSCMVAPDATVLVGGGMDVGFGEKAVYAFLTARLLDSDGRPYGKRNSSGE